MVTTKGHMSVNAIKGRNGHFNVATLRADIGDFIVRYEGLDQYEPGTYEGEFIIRDIDVRIRPFGVGKIIEPVAYLEGLNLYNADENCKEEIPEAILDPADEETKPKSFSKLDLASKDPDEMSDEDLAMLFGTAWPLGSQVKLDPTVGRKILRAQVAYIKHLKVSKSIEYEYNPEDQTWNLQVN